MNDVCDERSQKHNAGSQQIESDPPLFERGEEAGSYLHTDGVDKKNQPEFFQELQSILINLQTYMSQKYSEKENPGGSQRDPENLYFPQQKSYGDYQCKHQY